MAVDTAFNPVYWSPSGLGICSSELISGLRDLHYAARHHVQNTVYRATSRPW